MSADTHTIPDHIVARVERLINEAEDMRQQAADSLKQTYADLRDELRGMGWAGSTISAEVAAFKGAITEMRLDEKEVAKREAKSDRIGDYVSMVSRARARASRSYAEEKGRERPAQKIEEAMQEALAVAKGEAEPARWHGAEHQTATGTEQGHVESSAPRASSAVRVGATNSPDGQQGSGSITEVRAAPAVALAGKVMRAANAPAESASDEISATIPHSSDAPPPVETKAETVVSSSPAVSATPFNNPRCQKPDCHYAHSENACHECLLAWASRPRDEQVRLWAEARAA